jgi:hypothetical protein
MCIRVSSQRSTVCDSRISIHIGHCRCLVVPVWMFVFVSDQALA